MKNKQERTQQVNDVTELVSKILNVRQLRPIVIIISRDQVVACMPY